MCVAADGQALYGSLFGWIVNSVNEMLAPELHQKRIAGGRPGRAQAVAPTYEIGVLDIFGFENFKNNSFEQVSTRAACCTVLANTFCNTVCAFVVFFL